MKTNNNLKYKSNNLEKFYRYHRIRWEDFYPSEKKVIERLHVNAQKSVLDMGCGCGGLGAALKERFGVTDYTGVEVNENCINAAKDICPTGKFYCKDFLDLDRAILGKYNLAFSLSCADWQVETEKLLKKVFSCVVEDGHLLFSCRLTNDLYVTDMIEAKQRVQFDDNECIYEEYAPYKVFTLKSMLKLILSLGNINDIYGYGYWGEIPQSVVGLPLRNIFYIVFSIHKGSFVKIPRITLDVDADFIL